MNLHRAEEEGARPEPEQLRPKFTHNRPPEDDQTLMVISFEAPVRERRYAWAPAGASTI